MKVPKKYPRSPNLEFSAPAPPRALRSSLMAGEIAAARTYPKKAQSRLILQSVKAISKLDRKIR